MGKGKSGGKGDGDNKYGLYRDLAKYGAEAVQWAINDSAALTGGNGEPVSVIPKSATVDEGSFKQLGDGMQQYYRCPARQARGSIMGIAHKDTAIRFKMWWEYGGTVSGKGAYIRGAKLDVNLESMTQSTQVDIKLNWGEPDPAACAHIRGTLTVTQSSDKAAMKTQNYLVELWGDGKGFFGPS